MQSKIRGLVNKHVNLKIKLEELSKRRSKIKKKIFQDREYL